MLQFDLQVDRREKGTRHDLNVLRNKQFIPCVAYGYHEESVSLAVKETDLIHLFHQMGKENAIINLVINDEKKMTIIKDLQRNPRTYKISHIDFQILHEGEEIKVDVPIRLIGAPAGVKEGGVLEQMIREVPIKCLPVNIPQHLEVDVTDLELGESIHISDLEFTEGEILEDDSMSIATITAPKFEFPEETEEEEELAEPALIGEEEEEGEEGAEQAEDKEEAEE
ncbi:MAG: 50S ribosomal protein L25 [bacterium]